MTDHQEKGLEQHAEVLRQAFDQSFAMPLDERMRETVSCMGLRIQADHYAIRLEDITGLHKGLAITPCPSPLPELVGLAGIRGVLTAVYDLASLLGGEAVSAPWIVLPREEALGLGFDAFEGLLEFEPSMIAPLAASAKPHLSGVAHHDDQDWLIIDVASLLNAIHQKVTSIVARST